MDTVLTSLSIQILPGASHRPGQGKAPWGCGPAVVEKVSVLRAGITISHDKPSVCYCSFFPTM